MTLNRQEQLAYMAKICDKSLIRRRDLHAFNIVIKYLKDGGLTPEIKGLENSIYKGVDRGYENIDILIRSTFKPSGNFISTIRDLEESNYTPANLYVISSQCGLKHQKEINKEFQLEYLSNFSRRTLFNLSFTNS